MTISFLFFHLIDLTLSFSIYFDVHSLLTSPNFTICFFHKDCLLFNCGNCHFTLISPETDGETEGGGVMGGSPPLEISAITN